MVSSTLCPAVHILGSQNVYTVQQGRGYRWPLLALGRLFFMVLCPFSWSQQNFMVIAYFYDVGKLWFLLFMKCAKVHGFCLFLWSWHIFIVFAFLHEVVKIWLFLVETMRLYVVSVRRIDGLLMDGQVGKIAWFSLFFWKLAKSHSFFLFSWLRPYIWD